MAEEWTAEELEGMRDRLESMQAEMEAHLLSTAQSSKTVDLDEPIGRLSRMDAIQQQKMAVANRRNTEIQLNQVRNALNALEAGAYGECRACEEPIRKARLYARPESPFCLACQQSRERR